MKLWYDFEMSGSFFFVKTAGTPSSTPSYDKIPVVSFCEFLTQYKHWRIAVPIKGNYFFISIVLKGNIIDIYLKVSPINNLYVGECQVERGLVLGD